MAEVPKLEPVIFKPYFVEQRRLLRLRSGLRNFLAAATGLAISALWPFVAFSQPPIPSTFSDLQNHAAERPAINRMVSQGIMRPASRTLFAPDTANTLGDFAVSMRRMFDLPKPAQTTEFSDVPPSSPIYEAVQALAPHLGRQFLCFGCALGTNLLPDQPVSRAQATFTLVSILVSKGKLRLLDQATTEKILTGVTDTDKQSRLARPYFATAIKSGIVKLRAGNMFAPALKYTRADMAVLLDGVQKQFNIPVSRQPPQ